MWWLIKTLKSKFNKLIAITVEQNINHELYRYGLQLMLFLSFLPDNKIFRNISLGIAETIIMGGALYGQVIF